VLCASRRVVGMIEFSFAITEADMLRYTAYGVSLDPATDCRFGPTLADDYQGRGVGTLVLPFVIDVARRFGKRRIMLWGGVFANNARAIRYYEKNGFRVLGSFFDGNGNESFDMLLDL
jgi:GNAT superfamily N-acetyltransferase